MRLTTLQKMTIGPRCMLALLEGTKVQRKTCPDLFFWWWLPQIVRRAASGLRSCNERYDVTLVVLAASFLVDASPKLCKAAISCL